MVRSSYFVRKRNAGEEVQDEFKDAAWSALQVCPEPEDPNFHQVAGLLAYGPSALGKGQHCPRDGRPDCSIVDALEATSCLDLVMLKMDTVWCCRFFIAFLVVVHVLSIVFDGCCAGRTVFCTFLFCPPHIARWQGEVEGPHGSCRGLGATSSQPCPKHWKDGGRGTRECRVIQVVMSTFGGVWWWTTSCLVISLV